MMTVPAHVHLLRGTGAYVLLPSARGLPLRVTEYMASDMPISGRPVQGRLPVDVLAAALESRTSCVFCRGKPVHGVCE